MLIYAFWSRVSAMEHSSPPPTKKKSISAFRFGGRQEGAGGNALSTGSRDVPVLELLVSGKRNLKVAF